MPRHCQIEIRESFYSSLEILQADSGHFPPGAKGRNLIKDFHEFLGDQIYRRIAENPEHPEIETWPDGMPHPEGWVCRKLRTVYDRFPDRARHVRIRYALSPTKDEALIFQVFTHGQLDQQVAASLDEAVEALFD